MEKLKLQLEENGAAADQLLTEKMQAAASIIKNQTLEYAGALKDISDKETEITNLRSQLSNATDKISLDQNTLNSLQKILPDIQIPLELEESFIFILSNLLYRFDSAQNQIQEQNHCIPLNSQDIDLKVTSDGFNYEREVLEKENYSQRQDNRDLKSENKSLRDEINNLQQMITEIKVGVAKKMENEFVNVDF